MLNHEPHSPLSQSGINLLRHDAILSTQKDAAENLGRFIMPMAALRPLRTGDTKRAAASAKTIRLLCYLSLLTVITGFGLLGMADSKYDLSITTPWVLASLILYVVSLVATLVVTVPAFQNDGEHPHPSAYTRAAASSGVATLCLVAVVVLMVWKP